MPLASLLNQNNLVFKKTTARGYCNARSSDYIALALGLNFLSPLSAYVTYAATSATITPGSTSAFVAFARTTGEVTPGITSAYVAYGHTTADTDGDDGSNTQ